MVKYNKITGNSNKRFFSFLLLNIDKYFFTNYYQPAGALKILLHNKIWFILIVKFSVISI